MEYGYCRISTSKQSIERQVRNIEAAYPNAHIVCEVFTGRSFQGRKELEKILKVVKENDTIIFDSVSRMSRNADEGFELYQELYNKGVRLVFLKEPHINTDTYKNALKSKIELTGDAVDAILKGVNEYLMLLAKEQIRIAFWQAEKEVEDLRRRTKEGLITAKLEGKTLGRRQGIKVTSKKEFEAKEHIRKYSKDFDGSLSDVDCMKLIGISKNTYYKYKKELVALK